MAPSIEFVVLDDDLVRVTHVAGDDSDAYLGYFVLQTKRHVRGYAELSDQEAVAVGLATTNLCRAIKSCTAAENIYSVFFAEAVPHFHLLLTARYPNMPSEYWRMNILDWPDAPRGDRDQTTNLCRDIRQALLVGD